MGLAFAFGWTPCIGPVLGSILALAASRDSVAEGSLLLLLYSMGFGIPFILTAFFSSFFVRFLERLRSYFGVVEKIIGCFLIAFGVLLLMDKLDIFSYMIFKNFGSPLF